MIILLAILLLVSPAYGQMVGATLTGGTIIGAAATQSSGFTDDEFAGESLGGHWSTDGPGTVGVSGGYLTITTSSTTNTTVLQTVSGEFDIEAKILCPFYPGEIPSAQYQVAIVTYITGTIRTEAYQNYNPGEAVNEVKLVSWVDGFPYTFNPETSIMQTVYVRLKRDASNDFYVYYNTEPDRSGSWVEGGFSVGQRYNSSEDVNIGIRARSGTGVETTYQIDYVKAFE